MLAFKSTMQQNGGNLYMSLSTQAILDNKTKQLLAYLIDRHAVATVTSLVKLSYLSDLVFYQKTQTQISDLNYIRWHYGPYDSRISQYLLSLVQDGTVKSEVEFTTDGNEYYRYTLKNKSYDKSLLSQDEVNAVDAVLNSLVGYGANALIKVAYGTKPMKALNATIGGSEHLGEKLDLAIV